MSDPNLLVGTASLDDAGVYRLSHDRALVQTVDFFTPIVDDPFAYGEIAAANALSDVYAMGGRPITALNVVGIPTKSVGPKVIATILRGALAKAKEAGCVILGGHTIQNPEPIYGLAVTGLVSPRRMLTNSAARPGDLLVLTKPIGTGIVTTGIKRRTTSPRLARKVVTVMRKLNNVGAVLAEQSLVRAAVDVTGFGLLGHLGSMCRASRVGAELALSEIPAIDRDVFYLIDQGCVPGGTRQNLESADAFVEWNGTRQSWRVLLTDAQTSGGLLLCVSPRKWDAVRTVLQKHRSILPALIGKIVRSATPSIWIKT